MMALTISIVIALLTVAMLWGAARGQFTRLRTAEEVLHGLRRVDVLAMRNLIDPAQDEFLRAHLKAASFRRVQRARKRAAIDYVADIAHNAALLMRWGELARHSEDPVLRSSANEIINTSLAVRLHALSAVCKLALAVVFPATPVWAAVPADAYERLRTVLMASTGEQGRALVMQVTSAL